MDKKSPWGLDLDRFPRMSREDWVLLILAGQKKGRANSYAALMNDVFFFIKEFASAMEGEFGFRGMGYGPYSAVVAEAMGKLISDEIISIQNNKITGIYYYTLTDKGNSIYESLCVKIPKKERERMKFAEFLAQRMGALGTQQYLSSVYPEYVFIREPGDTPV